jgi:hypothetical protein
MSPYLLLSFTGTYTPFSFLSFPFIIFIYGFVLLLCQMPVISSISISMNMNQHQSCTLRVCMCTNVSAKLYYSGSVVPYLDMNNHQYRYVPTPSLNSTTSLTEPEWSE